MCPLDEIHFNRVEKVGESLIPFSYSIFRPFRFFYLSLSFSPSLHISVSFFFLFLFFYSFSFISQFFLSFHSFIGGIFICLFVVFVFISVFAFDYLIWGHNPILTQPGKLPFGPSHIVQGCHVMKIDSWVTKRL